MRRMNKSSIINTSIVNSIGINKRGNWQPYLLNAILVVFVLGVLFFFLYTAYFTGDDTSREVCRQSILIRSAMPEISKVGLTVASFKNDFPIKCRTTIVTITKEDIEENRSDNIIGDAYAECWFLFGVGDGNVFASSLYGKTTSCIPCARIHLTEDAKDLVNDTLGGKIDIEEILHGAKLDDKFFYLDYLKGAGELFEPFNPAFNNPFDLGGDNFSVGEFDGASSIKKSKSNAEIKMEGKFADVTLPKYLDVDQGDLIIVLGELTDSGTDDVSTHIPYMFYFQNGQENYLAEMRKEFFSGWSSIDDYICNSWEGIPA